MLPGGQQLIERLDCIPKQRWPILRPVFGPKPCCSTTALSAATSADIPIGPGASRTLGPGRACSGSRVCRRASSQP